MPTADEREMTRRSPITLRIRGGRKIGASKFGNAAHFLREEGDDLVFRSFLGTGHPITEHMKWMFGTIQHDAAEFKRAQQEGVETVLQIHSEAADFSLPPEALLLPHKLHLTLEIKLRA